MPIDISLYAFHKTWLYYVCTVRNLATQLFIDKKLSPCFHNNVGQAWRKENED